MCRARGVGEVWEASPEEVVAEVRVQELELLGDGWTLQNGEHRVHFFSCSSCGVSGISQVSSELLTGMEGRRGR